MSNNNPDKGVEQQRTAEEIAEELWDKHSELINDDVFSLERVAGSCIITRANFIKAIQGFASQYQPPIPPDISAWIKDEAEKEYPVLHLSKNAGVNSRRNQSTFIRAATRIYNLLSPKLTAQEQRVRELEGLVISTLRQVSFDFFKASGISSEEIANRMADEYIDGIKKKHNIGQAAQVSDTRDGDSKANPDKQNLAEQLRAMNPWRNRTTVASEQRQQGYDEACNKLQEIINDKK